MCVLALLVSALLFVKAEAQSFVAVLCGQVLDGGCYAWIIGCLAERQASLEAGAVRAGLT